MPSLAVATVGRRLRRQVQGVPGVVPGQMVASSGVLVTFLDTGHPGDQGGVLSARELAIVGNREQLHVAAQMRERLRVRGVVVERGDGYSGTYRNAWLRIEISGASVQVTASPTSPLGTLPVGSRLELACRMTGMVDVVSNTYYGERAQLLSWVAPK
jgi:hypothetical protein